MTDPESSRALNRWLADEQAERDAEAEAELEGLLHAIPRPAPAADLEDRIWRATRGARLRRSLPPRVRRVAAFIGALAAAALALYLVADVLIPLVARGIVRVVNESVHGFVWVLLALRQGLDTWSILVLMGRATAAVLTSPSVVTTLLVIELVGALAFYTLQRVLAREKEISQ